MTSVHLVHDPAPLNGAGSALMEGFLRRTRAADLCDMIAGCDARLQAHYAKTRDLTSAEEADADEAERELDSMRRELASIIRAQLGVSFDRLREANL